MSIRNFISKLLLIIIISGCDIPSFARRIKTPLFPLTIGQFTLTEETWEHIQEKHPDVTIEYIKITLLDPQLIVIDSKRPDTKIYLRRVGEEEKVLAVVVWLIVPVKGYVKTAYFTHVYDEVMPKRKGK